MAPRRVVLAVGAVLVLVGLSVPVSEAQAPATARLAGTVTADEDGRPLEGICVTVYSISSDGFHWLRRGTSSGAAPAPTTSGAGGAATSCAAMPTATTCSAARGSTAVAGGVGPDDRVTLCERVSGVP